MSDTKVFPNGFDSWRETHYEIVEKITLHINFWMDNDEELEPDNDPIFETKNLEGFTALWSLAEKWTDEFELLNKGREWDCEFIDEVEEFFNKKVNRE